MANYNNEYEKLLASIQGSGQNWSQYDLELAQKNPQAGYSIFESKNDWLDAQAKGDKAGMDAANKAANDVRQYYGSYDGGKDGSGFTLLPQYDEIPQFTEYESKYADQIQDLFDSIQNRDPFTYSPDADVSYQSYSEKYRNAGQKARDDTLGSMAAMTGGIPSSYAMTAAQQAQNNYNAALSDVLPQLEQLAYSKYVSEGNDMRQNLSTLMQMDNQAYQQHLDSYNNALNAWQLGYGVDRDRVGDIRYTDETDYNRNQYERELALEQAMTMLKLGVMPSEELLTASKMNAGDVQGIYEAIRAQLAADTKGGGSGGSKSSGGGSAKPKLTWPQVLKQIEDGNLTPTVLAAYEYYMGEKYKSGEKNVAKSGPLSAGNGPVNMNIKEQSGYASLVNDLAGSTHIGNAVGNAAIEKAMDMLESGEIDEETAKKYIQKIYGR